VSRRRQNKDLAHVVLEVVEAMRGVEPHLLSVKMDIHCSVECATAREALRVSW